MALLGCRLSRPRSCQSQTQSGLHSQSGALSRRLHFVGTQELRLRFISRTRAVAIDQYGFRAVIAPSYADIFFNNCFKNGLLPIVLPENIVSKLFDEVAAFPAINSPSILSAKWWFVHKVKKFHLMSKHFANTV
jgi:hypothetical protein